MSRRINKISDDIEAQVCLKLQETECSIQLDESTVPDNQALLLAYVRFINDKKICEEILLSFTGHILPRRKYLFKSEKLFKLKRHTN